MVYETSPRSPKIAALNEFHGRYPADHTWVYEQYKESIGCLHSMHQPKYKHTAECLPHAHTALFAG